MAVNKVIYGGNTLVDLTGDTVTAADLADGVKATGADGNPIVGLMQKVTIDAELLTSSTNPVQNKVIYNALLGKVGTDIFSGFALMGATSTIAWMQGSQPVGSINASSYTGTARAAICDGESNVITKTYAKKDTANTWTAEQSFIITKHNTEFSMDSTITPTASSIFCYVDGNITLDLNTIAAQVAEGETMIFRAYLLCSGDSQYTLTVKSPAIALLYTGDPVDYAISKWGTILTAYITNPTGNSQPFVILNTSKVGL